MTVQENLRVANNLFLLEEGRFINKITQSTILWLAFSEKNIQLKRARNNPCNISDAPCRSSVGYLEVIMTHQMPHLCSV